ncbi:hypothetical protein KB681_gp30 [Burkholderia phage Mica]|uniref:Uncharacterized protein n=1 Tax=Burkholderia phage Mica TaxID=2767579 RepID=A0A873WI83_9CAUD|nr:hypothetical protein KB681_gp30 [Burkholderia phage Mica]QPB08682.1 hypothetical protein CPT_Mica_070 [Burkholderia phage Mica]
MRTTEMHHRGEYVRHPGAFSLLMRNMLRFYNVWVLPGGARVRGHWSRTFRYLRGPNY